VACLGRRPPRPPIWTGRTRCSASTSATRSARCWARRPT